MRIAVVLACLMLAGCVYMPAPVPFRDIAVQAVTPPPHKPVKKPHPPVVPEPIDRGQDDGPVVNIDPRLLQEADAGVPCAKDLVPVLRTLQQLGSSHGMRGDSAMEIAVRFAGQVHKAKTSCIGSDQEANAYYFVFLAGLLTANPGLATEGYNLLQKKTPASGWVQMPNEALATWAACAMKPGAAGYDLRMYGHLILAEASKNNADIAEAARYLAGSAACLELRRAGEEKRNGPQVSLDRLLRAG